MPSRLPEPPSGATRDEAITAARAEYGSDVRIRGVRRIRSGGVAGFFSSERYVAAVVLPDEDAVAPRPGARTAVPGAPGVPTGGTRSTTSAGMASAGVTASVPTSGSRTAASRTATTTGAGTAGGVSTADALSQWPAAGLSVDDLLEVALQVRGTQRATDETPTGVIPPVDPVDELADLLGSGPADVQVYSPASLGRPASSPAPRAAEAAAPRVRAAAPVVAEVSVDVAQPAREAAGRRPLATRRAPDPVEPAPPAWERTSRADLPPAETASEPADGEDETPPSPFAAALMRVVTGDDEVQAAVAGAAEQEEQRLADDQDTEPTTEPGTTAGATDRATAVRQAAARAEAEALAAARVEIARLEAVRQAELTARADRQAIAPAPADAPEPAARNRTGARPPADPRSAERREAARARAAARRAARAGADAARVEAERSAPETAVLDAEVIDAEVVEVAVESSPVAAPAVGAGNGPSGSDTPPDATSRIALGSRPGMPAAAQRPPARVTPAATTRVTSARAGAAQLRAAAIRAAGELAERKVAEFRAPDLLDEFVDAELAGAARPAPAAAPLADRAARLRSVLAAATPQAELVAMPSGVSPTTAEPVEGPMAPSADEESAPGRRALPAVPPRAVDRAAVRQPRSGGVAEPVEDVAAPAGQDAEQSRLAEADRLLAERIETERIETERIEAERIEAERIEAERIEADRIAIERATAARVAAQQAAAAQRAEARRIAAEQAAAAEAERIATELAEARRIAAEQEAAAARRAEAERVAALRAVAERAEAQRLAAEQAAEAERVAAEQAEARRVAAEEAAAAEAARRADAERAEAQRIAAERAAATEARRIATELAEAERAEARRIAAEQAAAAEAELVAAEQAAAVEAQRIATELAEAERVAVERAGARRAAAARTAGTARDERAAGDHPDAAQQSDAVESGRRTRAQRREAAELARAAARAVEQAVEVLDVDPLWGTPVRRPLSVVDSGRHRGGGIDDQVLPVDGSEPVAAVEPVVGVVLDERGAAFPAGSRYDEILFGSTRATGVLTDVSRDGQADPLDALRATLAGVGTAARRRRDDPSGRHRTTPTQVDLPAVGAARLAALEDPAEATSGFIESLQAVADSDFVAVPPVVVSSADLAAEVSAVLVQEMAHEMAAGMAEELARTASDPAPSMMDATSVLPSLNALVPSATPRVRGSRPPVPPTPVGHARAIPPHPTTRSRGARPGDGDGWATITHLVPVTDDPASPEGGPAGLAALGVPASVLGADFAAEADRRGTFAALAAALGRALPAAPAIPSEPGDVLVVVGPGAEALTAARAVAVALRLDPARVQWATRGALAGLASADVQVAGASTAAVRRAAAADADVPTVVAVDVPLGDAGGAWAAQMLQAWAPTAVWGVLDSTRKAGALRGWLAGLPRVDAVIVTDTESAPDPAALLDRLPVPVAVVDGARATPHRWAALLCERLAGRS